MFASAPAEALKFFDAQSRAIISWIIIKYGIIAKVVRARLDGTS